MEVPMTTTIRSGLRRSRRDRVLAGVCGGLSEFFGIGAFWFRLSFLIAALPGGVPGISLYLLLWLVIPKASE
jgi:phage shock protein C